MKVVTQVAEQRKTLEQAVAQALELARAGSDAAEVAVGKTTGISVSTRFGEVENVEFNNDGARWELPFITSSVKAVPPPPI